MALGPAVPVVEEKAKFRINPYVPGAVMVKGNAEILMCAACNAVALIIWPIAAISNIGLIRLI